jgi:hypothetical protein
VSGKKEEEEKGKAEDTGKLVGRGVKEAIAEKTKGEK